MCMERGTVGQYQGKTLEEVEVDNDFANSEVEVDVETESFECTETSVDKDTTMPLTEAKKADSRATDTKGRSKHFLTDEEIKVIRKPSSSTSNISVYVSSKKSNGQRNWNKSARCNFCEKISTSTNITKHIISAHKKEAEVAEIMSKPKRSKERALLIEKQRNLGNYKHNCEVLRAGKGMIIPWQAPSEQVQATDYSPCEHCLGFFLKKDLWRHEKKCKFNLSCARKGRKVISRSQMLLPTEMSCSEALKENILSSMTDDDVSYVAKNDRLIIAYAEKLYQKYRLHHKSYIRAKIREIARFLIAARKASDEAEGQKQTD